MRWCLQRHVDQVRRIVLGLHRFVHRRRSDLAGLLLVVLHPEPLADDRAVMPRCTVGVVPRDHVLLQPQQPAHMSDHQLRHLIQAGKVVELLETLQQHRQRRQMLRGPRLAPCPRHLRRARSERLMQLTGGDRALEPRVRGTFHRSHTPHDPRHLPIRSTHSNRRRTRHRRVTREETLQEPRRNSYEDHPNG
jgi:hypothetical protein